MHTAPFLSVSHTHTHTLSLSLTFFSVSLSLTHTHTHTHTLSLSLSLTHTHTTECAGAGVISGDAHGAITERVSRGHHRGARRPLDCVRYTIPTFIVSQYTLKNLHVHYIIHMHIILDVHRGARRPHCRRYVILTLILS